MSVIWVDASAGASGDMLLGALVDAGVPIKVLQSALDPLELGITFRAEEVRRGALGATKVNVDVPEPAVLRHLPQILELLALLPDHLAAGAGAVFRRLAQAEAKVHRVPIDEVHFHEVGALDCIADVVGVVAGLAHLQPTRVVCSPISLGSGHANTEHGRIPVPVPAVLELVDGVPCSAGPAPFESTTPTGAALLVTLADEFGPMPPMTVTATGSGAGTRDSTDFANIVRVVVGSAVGEAAPAAAEGAPTVHHEVQLDANVDDLDPRIWPAAIAALIDAGAHDAWVTPITMKKGRPALTVSALCDPAVVADVRHAMFVHTSTIGVREHAVTKHALARTIEHVEVDGERIAIKVASVDSAVVNRSVEWDDVVAAAERLGRSTKAVLAEATKLANTDAAR